jgi:hypothetical protein
MQLLFKNDKITFSIEAKYFIQWMPPSTNHYNEMDLRIEYISDNKKNRYLL